MAIRRMKAALILAALLTGTSIGCATTRVGTDRDPNVNFAWYRTFAIQTGRVVNNGMRDDRDTLVRDRIDAAIRYVLQLKGLRPTTIRPDLIVTYTAVGLTHGEEGMTGNPLNGFTPIYNDPSLGPHYRQGKIIIDVFDPLKRKLVWRSVATAYNQDFRSAEFIAQAVDEALEQYPTWVHPT
jgi:hypothetical protein